MTERTRNGKAFAKSFTQDALGFLFCLVGGFFAVSIVLFLRGQEPRPGLVSVMTWPVLELVLLFGAPAGLFFALGLAALGALLFLRSSAFSPLRPLLALFFGALGVASILGAFGGEGLLGTWLPALVPGFVGRLLALVLGVALAWLGWTLVAAVERAPGRSSSELVQRMGLAARHDASAGVSPAEAALLVSEPRAPVTRPAPRREVPAPVRDETIRPFTPSREAPASESRAARFEIPGKPARATLEPLPAVAAPTGAPAPSAAERAGGASEPQVSVLTPPAPSWESAAEESQADLEELEELDEEESAGEGEEGEEGEEAAQHLTAALSEEFETEDASAVEAASPPASAAAAPAPPPASWEQVGLFDEEEALEDEAPLARRELTPTFDFEGSEPMKSVHEPEQEGPSARAAAPGELQATAPPLERDGDEVEDAPAPPAVVLKPAAPPSAPVLARDEEGEGWGQLVYDAGCVILEQQRVTVSLLERRFGIDFDQACRVLDELQQAGLIGPYMGGRTRDILLSREQWLPHAPHAS